MERREKKRERDIQGEVEKKERTGLPFGLFKSQICQI